MEAQFPGNPVNEFKQTEDGVKFENIYLVSKNDVFKFAEHYRI